ncbi:MAG: DUF4349 domain-containing protein [Lachnospiraceae bacterium]|nr:DUF4349 domain-containing protein [Lachnospiraceae bacterium]
MKKNGLPKIIVKAIACVSALALLSGCGMAGSEATDSFRSYNAKGASGGTASNYAEVSYKSDYAAEDLWTENTAVDNGAYDGGEAPQPDNYSKTSASKRKLIKNVSMNVETQEYDQLMANLDKRIKELGGYVQSMESYNGSTYNSYGKYDADRYGVRRNANMVVRIPQDKLDDFVQSISDLANVVNRREGVEDVTLQYVDVQSHKESLQVEQERLLALLERAETLEDIITLENRLSSVRYQIESMESTLRTYDDLVDYSTVTLRIDEVKEYTPVVEEVEEETNWQRMTRGFMESVESVWNGAINLGIAFVINLPYFVIWAIVILVIVLIVKKVKKGKNKKSANASDAGETVADEHDVKAKLEKAMKAKAEKQEEKKEN